MQLKIHKSQQQNELKDIKMLMNNLPEMKIHYSQFFLQIKIHKI